MKKQIIFLLSLLSSSAMFAQFHPSFGIRAGATSAGMRGDAVNSLNKVVDFTNGMLSAKDRVGFFAGPYANIPVGHIVSVEPALYYTQKGYSLTGSINTKGISLLGVNAKAQLNSQYIDLPVMLKANFNGFQVFAGPQISYLVKSELRTTGGVLGINILNTKTDATQQFNKWDAAFSGGVGYQFANGFNISAAYDYGLSKVDANQSMKSYNRALKLGVGMQF